MGATKRVLNVVALRSCFGGPCRGPLEVPVGAILGAPPEALERPQGGPPRGPFTLSVSPFKGKGGAHF